MPDWAGSTGPCAPVGISGTVSSEKPGSWPGFIQIEYKGRKCTFSSKIGPNRAVNDEVVFLQNASLAGKSTRILNDYYRVADACRGRVSFIFLLSRSPSISKLSLDPGGPTNMLSLYCFTLHDCISDSSFVHDSALGVAPRVQIGFSHLNRYIA